MSPEQKDRVTSNPEGTHHPPTNRLGSIKWTLMILLLTSLFAGGVLTILLYYQTRSFAVAEAEKKINELLLQQLSINDYVTGQQKPEVYRLKKEGLLYPDYFSPQLLSGSYIRRNIQDYYNLHRKEAGKDEFYYKLAAINPRNPINKADEFELKLIEKLHTSGDSKYSEVIEIDGIQYLYVAIPYAENTAGCMRCHGDPADAPREMVEMYGDKAGFYEKVGGLRAITSIRVPLESELAEARGVFLKQGVMVFSVLIVIFVFGCAAILNHYSKLSQNQLKQMNIQLEQTVAERTANLRESEERYRTLVEGTENLVTRVDKQGNFIYVNPAAERFFGLKPQDCVGLSAFDFVHPDDRETTQEAFATWLRDKTEDTAFENRQVSRDGNVAHMLWTTRLVLDESGDIAWIDGIARDITERKQGEQEREELLIALESKNRELSQKTQFSEEIINSLPGLFYMFDEKRFVQWNDEWETVTGYSPQELSERYGPDFFEGEDSVLISRRMQKVFVEGASDAEAELVTKSGEKIPYYFTGHLCRMGDKNYLIGLGIDITTRKTAEREREELLKTVSAKNEELQSIVYTVSHDLKSPLVNINGFSELLSQSIKTLTDILKELKVSEDVSRRLLPVINEDIPESVTYITAGTAKMKKLLDGLLQVSRIGTQELRIQKLDMNRLMQSVMDTVAFQIKDKDISLTGGDLPPCRGDEKQINQAFSNLVSNAIKYLSPGRQGVIKVSGRVSGNECIYGIEDNGIGIDKDHQPKVFELFHRLHPDDSTDSQGLGLTITKRALDRNGGRIWVESEKGKGSTFFVSLPSA